MVLFLFVVMLLDINLDRLREGFWSYLPMGGIAALLMVAEMSLILGGSYYGVFESDAADRCQAQQCPGGCASPVY